MLLLALLLNPPALSTEQIQSSVITQSGQLISEKISWVKLPTDKEIKPLLPKSKVGFGYAHIRCSAIRSNGQPLNCETSRDGLGPNASLDSDFERAGLAAVNLMRADPYLARHWSRKDLVISINIAFENGASPRKWGDCYPFCQAGLPPAPVAPSQ